jgi:thiamine-phosphate diphosphorylase
MLVTEPMDRDRLVEIVREAAAGGVTAVMLRDKTASDAELTETALALKQVLGSTPLIVNGSALAARTAEAAGVHLPETGMAIAAARRIAGGAALVGRSVHSVEAAMSAASRQADYVLAGTIYASRSHPGVEPAGPAFLKAVCSAVTIPVVAIGGISPGNCASCLAAGARGVAVLSAILHAQDPREAAARYRMALGAFMGE